MKRQKADEHALNIARAVQESVAPDTVILFGSRAAGDYHEDSDVDLLVVIRNRERSRNGAGAAASQYMKEHPPWLDVNVVTMTLEDFDRNRRAKQHLAGQAERHGVVMSGESLDYSAEHEDEYPEHWPATRKRLENTAEWMKEFNDMVDRDHWNQKAMGFAAQQALENALKGWLSTFNDPSRFRHDLDRLWDHLETLQGWSEPGTGQLHRSLTELFEHTQYEKKEPPGAPGNWLADYADQYRYDINPRRMNREEKLRLRELVNHAVENLVNRVHDVSGTTDRDIFTEGGPPWE